MIKENGDHTHEIMLAPELAVYLRLHIKTVYKLAETGVIPGKRIGRSWRFSRGDILEWIEQCQHRNSPL